MHKSVIIPAGFIIITSFLLLCTDNPVDNTSPDNAFSNILLVSPSFDTVDTMIIDSVGKEIEIIISYELGYFIDSVYIDIYSDASLINENRPDTQIIIRFNKDDLRDTMRFPIKFQTEGIKRFIVRTFKHRGLFSTSSATAYILNIEANSPRSLFPKRRRGYTASGKANWCGLP